MGAIGEAGPGLRARGYRFGVFEADPDSRELRKHGLKVQLPAQSFQVLESLLLSPGIVVTREQLQEKLWPGVAFVDADHGLNKAVNKLRAALGDSADNPRFIETLPKIGYRFLVPVEEIYSLPSPAKSAPPSPQASLSRWVAGVSVGLFVIACLVSWAMVRNGHPPATLQRTNILLPPGIDASKSLPSLSPDARQLAFTARYLDGRSQGKHVLWIRPLESLDAAPQPGTDDAIAPFWSPDGTRIGFFSQTRLQCLDRRDGSVRTLAVLDAHSRGASWGGNGDILVGLAGTRPIYRIPESGGPPIPVTRPESQGEAVSHRFPGFLPDGRHFVYFAVKPNQARFGGEIRLASLDGTDDRFLLKSDSGAVYTGGSLLFLLEGKLLAQPIQGPSFHLDGPPAVLAEGLSPFEGRVILTASEQGAVAYRPGSPALAELAWFDRAGRPIGTLGPQANLFRVRLSPDATKAAADFVPPGAAHHDLWVIDARSGSRLRLSGGDAIHSHPIWSPDGSRIAYSAGQANGRDGRWLHVRSADGSGEGQLLFDPDGDVTASDWSPDGATIAVNLRDPRSARQSIWFVPVNHAARPSEFAPARFDRKDAQFSPDGRYLAFTSNETGREEVYLAALPHGSSQVRVSTEGGLQPRWRRDGGELFFISHDGQMMSARIARRSGGLSADSVRPLFQVATVRVGIGHVYDVTAGGERFLITIPKEQSPAPLVLMTNWQTATHKRQN